MKQYWNVGDRVLMGPRGPGVVVSEGVAGIVVQADSGNLTLAELDEIMGTEALPTSCIMCGKISEPSVPTHEVQVPRSENGYRWNEHTTVCTCPSCGFQWDWNQTCTDVAHAISNLHEESMLVTAKLATIAMYMHGEVDTTYVYVGDGRHPLSPWGEPIDKGVTPC